MKLGAHVSIRGRIHLAVDRARAIGCECLQIFVGSPRQWREVVYADADLDLFIEKRARAGIDPLVAHTAYLINLGAADSAVHRKSTAALVYALRTMDRLQGLGAVTHLGSRGGQPWARASARVVAALTAALEATDRAMILMEHSVGAGGQIGGTFEELAEILDRMDHDPRLGICLDTCHLFAAGYDLRTADGVEATLRAFDRIVGLRHLHALHLNDSRGALGSRLDRHEDIGKGRIGLAGFRALVNHPRLRRLGAFIETPHFEEEGPDRRNLDLLKRLRREGAAQRRVGAAGGVRRRNRCSSSSRG
ncbi:MAG: deoxyribonuclease IV [Armatimonadota bacterium]|nr:deoxyribonuclease IV [Armatimonadota bacterium]MDR7451696.1 deoxyribonuclease IV [Armatimonadota bacterium]MDR7465686.1 deoxyribonuclease IV [Armatimonadota bacterium]MDR7493595.1 deoxyribonuclease IV [Armatimonadota bacterium]MDR7499501.1 deoxyribonuclease IV [Armatimonadota bacterium]